MRAYILAAIVIFIIILAITIYILLSPAAPGNVLVSDQFDLSKSQSVVKADMFTPTSASMEFLKSGTGTYQCFIYLENLARTGSVSGCSDRPNHPSCSNGLYEPCKCNALADCTNCVHDGYKQLFSLYGVYTFEILNVPDASRQNAVSAQIAVRTQAGNDGYVETIPLPPLNLQKWTMITVTKEGRRVSVYYNDTLVSSSKVINMVSRMNPSGSIVQAGNSGLSGTITLVSLAPNTKNIRDVSAYYADNVDTRGNPLTLVTKPDAYTARISKVKKSSLFSAMCLDGSCLSLPRVNVASPTLPQFAEQLLSWKSERRKATVPTLYTVESAYS
jgi:hypothetical protein